MYNSQRVVGDFFEEQLSRLFGLKRLDPGLKGICPDLISADGRYYAEVKAASYKNGGVIKRKQLYRFRKDVYDTRFFFLSFHSLTDIQRTYRTEADLREALALRSLYIFPFSIVEAFFRLKKKRKYKKDDEFVTLNEAAAKKIFCFNQQAWGSLALPQAEYRPAERGRVHLLTRGGKLEEEILQSITQ